MKIYFDVPFILTSLVLISGLITLIDALFYAKKRKNHKTHKPWIVEHAHSFFPMLLLVWTVRSFIIQPYRVPTGSLEPTILPGDFIVVNQFAYGLRLPVLNIKLLHLGEPKRGDIALFRYPNDPSVIYVKRVVGLPGDHIAYHNKILTINDKIMPQDFVGIDLDTENGFTVPVKVFVENLDGIKHKIFIKPDHEDGMDVDVIVPENNYFMMGDNRDSSADSRYWGFMPEENLIGKAFGIWMNFDTDNFKVKWERIGKKIQ